jgi:hypothetical protein
MDAICARCGAGRVGWASVCPGCGDRPEGDGLAVAWLLSRAHLDADELEEAARRIRDGWPLQPSEALLQRAIRAIGRHADTSVGLSTRAHIGLIALSWLVTPWVAWAVALHERDRSPKLSRQAAWIAAPATLGVGAAWLGIWLWQHGALALLATSVDVHP